MSAGFTVEDGSGVTGANSYISLVDAEAEIALDVGNHAAWDALADDEKELRLSYATRWLDDRVIWRGKKVSGAQSLAWPRKHVKDSDGCDISETVLPVEVSRSTARLALYLLNEGEPDSTTGFISRFKADTFEVDFEQGYIRNTTPEFLRFSLNGLGSLATVAGFKKIVRA